jgi:hypothetical protein
MVNAEVLQSLWFAAVAHSVPPLNTFPGALAGAR